MGIIFVKLLFFLSESFATKENVALNYVKSHFVRGKS